jgi:hypothetical protein
MKLHNDITLDSQVVTGAHQYQVITVRFTSPICHYDVNVMNDSPELQDVPPNPSITKLVA